MPVHIRAGVHRHSLGRWVLIQEEFSLGHRTNVNLKDRWRTLDTAVQAGKGSGLGLDREQILRVLQARY